MSQQARCSSCGRVLPWASDGQAIGKLCLACALPPVMCCRCGKRPAVYLLKKWTDTGFCEVCYTSAIGVSVHTGELVPA